MFFIFIFKIEHQSQFVRAARVGRKARNGEVVAVREFENALRKASGYNNGIGVAESMPKKQPAKNIFALYVSTNIELVKIALLGEHDIWGYKRAIFSFIV